MSWLRICCACITALQRTVATVVRLWCAVNGIEVVMWGMRTADGVDYAALSLVMWTVFLLIGIIMWIRWSEHINAQ